MRRAGITRLLIVTVGIAAAGMPALPADAQTPVPTFARQPGTPSPVVLGPAPATPTIVPPTTQGPTAPLRAASAATTFVVNYDAGFTANPAAKAAFQAAVDQWANVISSPVPIVVDASFTNLPSGVLGSAGPRAWYANFSGAPVTDTWFPVALANVRHGSDLDPTHADIGATFSSSYPGFYFGTDGNTAGKVDFESVVLHELGHGLGFVGLAGKSSQTGTWSCCAGSSYPGIYDRFTTSNGAPVATMAPATLPTALQGADVRFIGAAALAANGGVAPRLYAPNPWQGGSSYSHLDEATYPAGNANSLMTPAIGANEVIHSPGPVTLGIFSDSGWTVGGLPELGVGGTRIVEGNAGARQLRFNVSISKVVPWTVSAHFATSDDTASSLSDYTARTGTVIIPAGTARTTVSVSVNGDTVTEALERFRLALSAPSGAVLGLSSAFGSIINDEPSSGVQVSASNTSIVEGDSGNRSIGFGVTLSAPSASPVTVHWTTGSGTAIAGIDYRTTSGTLTIPAGATSGQVAIAILADQVTESAETFTVVLSAPGGATIQRATGTATIVDDD